MVIPDQIRVPLIVIGLSFMVMLAQRMYYRGEIRSIRAERNMWAFASQYMRLLMTSPHVKFGTSPEARFHYEHYCQWMTHEVCVFNVESDNLYGVMNSEDLQNKNWSRVGQTAAIITFDDAGNVTAEVHVYNQYGLPEWDRTFHFPAPPAKA